MRVFLADILINKTKYFTPPIPLDVANFLPGIELWFGTYVNHKIRCMCHMDTRTAMNTGNLLVHQWLITTNPSLIAEYIQFDYARPFEPLQFRCTVKDLVKTKSMHGKLTVIVRHWLRYEHGGKKVLISFGLGASVAVNYNFGIPKLKS